MTQSWRQPLDDTERSPLFNGARSNQMTHPAYSGRSFADTPPSIRIGMLVACSPVSPVKPATSDLRRAVLRLMSRPAISELLSTLTDVEGLAWQSRDCHGRHNLGAVLSNGDDKIAPTAWTRVLLPDPSMPQFGRDPRCAEFLLHVEPRRRGRTAPPRTLAEWHQVFTRALSVFETVTRQLLVAELGLTSDADPAGKVAVWQNTPTDLTQLVDIGGYKLVAGTHMSSQFGGYAVADEAGAAPAALAVEWLRQLCDTALYLDDYEDALVTLGPVG